MQTRLIYRRPVAGSPLKPLLGEFTEAELRAFVGEQMADRLLAGEVAPVGDYTAVDLVAFYEACADAATETRCIRMAEGAAV
jgi:hypothetical protein